MPPGPHNPSAKRKLAAIMFTDIVGYTALMGSDEENALEVLRANRAIHMAAIEKYGGKWLKEIGDAVLARFNSAVHAVQCALEIQKNASNLGAQLRIGIHLGDVTFENEDVFGDGVNIASRIQSVADPGGIYFSESIFAAIRSHAEFKANFLGDVPLKNVDHLVKTYYLVDDALPVPKPEKIKSLLHPTASDRRKATYLLITVFMVMTLAIFWWIKGNEQEEIRSLVVLPVENLTGNAEVDFYAAGIHDAINNEIGKFRELRVPSTRTSVQYKEARLTIPEIAQELNVQGVVETSLFYVGDSIRVRVKLIDADPDERQIWSQEFSRDIPHILAMYNDIATSIAKELKIQLPKGPQFMLASQREVIPQAYEAYLRGMFYWDKLTSEDLETALRYFELSATIDPDFAPAYTGIALVWGGRMQQGIVPSREVGTKLDSLLQKALAIDSTLAEVQYCNALFNTWWNWDWQQGGKAFRKAIAINPNHAGAHMYYSHYLNIVGQPEDALVQAEMALELDPLNALFIGLYGMDLVYARKFDEAIEVLRKGLETAPGNPIILSTLRTSYYLTKQFDKAYEIFLESYARDDEAVNTLNKGYETGGYNLALTNLSELLIERSKTQHVTPYRIFTLYTRVGNNEEALKYLKLAYEEHDSNMPHIHIDPIFDELKSYAEFQEIVAKMNFPNQ